jgi:hypothetical protein
MCMCMCMYVCMYVCMYACVCVCVCVYMSVFFVHNERVFCADLAPSYKHTHAQTAIYTLILHYTIIIAHTHTHTHTNYCTHTHTLIVAHTHTCLLLLSLSHTHTHTQYQQHEVPDKLFFIKRGSVALLRHAATVGSTADQADRRLGITGDDTSGE